MEIPMSVIRNLGFGQLENLLRSSFLLNEKEKDLSILVDLPDARTKDSARWQDRRRIAAEWYLELQGSLENLPFRAVNLCTYPNVGTNNGDLPARVTVLFSASLAGAALERGMINLKDVLSRSSVVLSVTEYSATAPLKVLARDLKFRGATLPGFSRAMIPALGLDYRQVDARVRAVADRLTRAEAAKVTFGMGDSTQNLIIDLRHRAAHVSGGIISEPGTVANLPSGEAYIVPYEGENEGEPSRTEGSLPVQFGDEIVSFKVERNRCVKVLTEGPESARQASMLAQEPAYGNLAELGIGVLGEWGVQAVGSTLLDEKLGPHLAFGRSDHFGGATGPSSFLDPSRVTHVDWVYVESIQPRISVRELLLRYADGAEETLVRDGKLTV
jgi:hypothetical protein